MIGDVNENLSLTIIFFVVFVQGLTDAAYKTVIEQLQAVQSLSGKGATEFTVLDPSAEKPLGCVAYSISSEAVVFLYVKGLVDMDDEIEKAQKKLEKSNQALKKQQKIINDPGYKIKVSVETRESDMKKLVDLETEANHFRDTIAQFESLKIE